MSVNIAAGMSRVLFVYAEHIWVGLFCKVVWKLSLCLHRFAYLKQHAGWWDWIREDVLQILVLLLLSP